MTVLPLHINTLIQSNSPTTMTHKHTNPVKLTNHNDSPASAHKHTNPVKLTNHNDSPASEWLWVPVAADMTNCAFELLHQPRNVRDVGHTEEAQTQYDAIKMRRHLFLTFGAALDCACCDDPAPCGAVVLSLIHFQNLHSPGSLRNASGVLL